MRSCVCWAMRLLATFVVASVTSGAFAASTARLIVKFRDEATKAEPVAVVRVARLAAELRVPLYHVRAMAVGADVLALEAPVALSEAEAIAKRVAQHPDVEYAHPDRVLQWHLVPNDPDIGSQTYLDNGPVSISAYAAWDVTTGSSNTVVAVVDSGYTDHPAMAGRFLPGYDFVSSAFYGADGDGRDPDAHDPGDWASNADDGMAVYPNDCYPYSLWHGTSTAGVIAANSNDGAYTAGIDWAAKILPVRVAGKCFDSSFSDAIDGIAWAGGLDVPGVPPNPYPAQVMNLSFGTGLSDYRSACESAFQSVIDAVLAKGITRAIVASAGNDNADIAGNTEPANCAGVISVAATDESGNKASFSSFGAVTISAPGTNILGLTNTGRKAPSLPGTARLYGTSVAAPMVTGTVSLMLAVAPNLSAADVRSILRSSAKPFPVGSTCSTAICGAGIVDAHAAVVAAQAFAQPPATVQVMEYYNASQDHYFITWIANEIAILDAGVQIKGWQRTGYSFLAYPTATGGTSDICRFYIPPADGDSHFYGRGSTECAATGAAHPDFVLEDPKFMAMFLPTVGVCPATTTEVYRVFDNRVDANHRYMTDKTVRDQMVAKGWVAEGDGPDLVVMCAPQ